jgi:hypothetical protein
VDYDEALKSLKMLPGAAVQGIPYSTRNVIQNLPTKVSQSWASDEDIDGRLKKLPLQLQDALLPFQLEGVKFGLKRHGRCLIADEMGLGKTLQVSRKHECLHICFCSVLSMSIVGILACVNVCLIK